MNLSDLAKWMSWKGMRIADRQWGSSMWKPTESRIGTSISPGFRRHAVTMTLAFVVNLLGHEGEFGG